MVRSPGGGHMDDFGDFVGDADPNEAAALRIGTARARKSLQTPGHEYMRLVLYSMDILGYNVEGARHVHIDLHDGTATWIEVWGGVVTAQRTQPLPR
jgi:hypothetical protein